MLIKVHIDGVESEGGLLFKEVRGVEQRWGGNVLVSSEICKFSDLATSEFHVQVHFVSGSFLVIIIIEKKDRGNVVKKKCSPNGKYFDFISKKFCEERKPPAVRIKETRGRPRAAVLVSCLEMSAASCTCSWHFVIALLQVGVSSTYTWSRFLLSSLS